MRFAKEAKPKKSSKELKRMEEGERPDRDEQHIISHNMQWPVSRRDEGKTRLFQEPGGWSGEWEMVFDVERGCEKHAGPSSMGHS